MCIASILYSSCIAKFAIQIKNRAVHIFCKCVQLFISCKSLYKATFLIVMAFYSGKNKRHVIYKKCTNALVEAALLSSYTFQTVHYETQHLIITSLLANILTKEI